MTARQYTTPYPARVKRIMTLTRAKEAAAGTLKEKITVRAWVRLILAHEYSARYPRYTLIRFLKAHR